MIAHYRVGRCQRGGLGGWIYLTQVCVHIAASLGAHDLHAGTISSGMPALSVHVVVGDQALAPGGGAQVLDVSGECLDVHFDVDHCTFQLEPAGHAGHEQAAHP